MLLLLIMLLVMVAADWPTYLHDPERTAANDAETVLSTTTAPQLTKLWSFQTGGYIASSPSVVGNTVYVGSWDGYEYALDAVTGALKWKAFLGYTANATCTTRQQGISSAATVQNGVAYVGGGGTMTGTTSISGTSPISANWYALDATSGMTLWSTYTGGTGTADVYYNWSSPLLYNGDAYVGTAGGDCDADPGTHLQPGRLLQVELTTHRIINTFYAVPPNKGGGALWTSPAVDPSTNTLYVTTGNEDTEPASTTEPLALSMVALDAATLGVKGAWQIPSSYWNQDLDWGTTPIVFTDALGRRLVGAGNKNGIFYVFDGANVSAGPLWQLPIAQYGPIGSEPEKGDGTISSAAFGGGRLYVAGGNTSIPLSGTSTTPYSGSVRALDPATGQIIWERGTSGVVLPALAYANGLLVDGEGSTLDVRDASNGSVLYKYVTGNTLWSAPSIANGEIFVGSKDKSIYAFGLAIRSTPTPTTTSAGTATPTPTTTSAGTATPTPTTTSAGTATPTPAGNPVTSSATPTLTSTVSATPTPTMSGGTVTPTLLPAASATPTKSTPPAPATPTTAPPSGPPPAAPTASSGGTPCPALCPATPILPMPHTATPAAVVSTPAPTAPPSTSPPSVGSPRLHRLFVRPSPLQRSVMGGGSLTMHILTLAHARIRLTLQVSTTRLIVTGKGRHRTRRTQTKVLYRVTAQGVADAHGHYRAVLHISYEPSRPVQATLIIAAQLTDGRATVYRTHLLIAPLSHIPLVVTAPRAVLGGGLLRAHIRTSARAHVRASVQVTLSSVRIIQSGRHRKRVTRTVVLFRSTVQGTADEQGHLTISLRIAFRPAVAVHALLMVTADSRRGIATQNSAVLIEPRR